MSAREAAVHAGVLVCALLAARLAGARAEGAALRRARLLGMPPVGGGPGAGPARGDDLLRWLRRRWAGVGREWWCVGGGALLALLGASPLPLLAGLAAVPLVRRRLARGERLADRARRADAVVALCGVLIGELRAGRQPEGALVAAARDTASEAGRALGSQSSRVLAAARFGGDVPAALREAARAPGGEGLAGLAACWRTSVDHGAGLAEGLMRLEAALREQRSQEASLRARLSGARAAAGALALLPVVGLLMGAGLGAEPLRILLHTPAGIGCLLVGGGLEALGMWWVGRIVRAGEGR
ncbi:type II secretion system F family protein [Streptomyces sp. NPDC060194]|uniref:type II secretion system F family protein n=1 Tax=Streptomyces sp. NPDC060194 TaxID=3347069 RepID=UPI00365CB536